MATAHIPLLAGLIAASISINSHADSNVFFSTSPASALPLPAGNDLFKGTVQVTDQHGHTITKQYNENTSIDSIVKKYSQMESNPDFKNVDWEQAQVDGNLNLRGLPIYLHSSPDSSTVSIEVAGDKESFTDQPGGETAYQQLGDWLQGKSGDTGVNVLKDISRAFVSSTSIDPIAGNPNSLFSSLVGGELDATRNLILNANSAHMNIVSLSPEYSDDSSQNPSGHGQAQVHEENLTLPLMYSHYFNRDNVVTVNVPFRYSVIGAAKSYNAAIGLYYTHVMKRSDHLTWALSPQVQTGANASFDMGSGTVAYSAGVSSRTVYHRHHLTTGLTNVIAFMKTVPIKIGDFETPYDVENIATESGIDLAYALNSRFKIGGSLQRFQILSGSKWHIPSYNAIGISLAMSTHKQSPTYNQIAVSANYAFGKNNFKGFQGGVSITF